jgi:hypothetical protein
MPPTIIVTVGMGPELVEPAALPFPELLLHAARLSANAPAAATAQSVRFFM